MEIKTYKSVSPMNKDAKILENKDLFQECKPASTGSSAGKETACNAGDLGSIPGWRRSPGEGKGYPIQYSGLENSMVHGVAKSRTQLSDFNLI